MILNSGPLAADAAAAAAADAAANVAQLLNAPWTPCGCRETHPKDATCRPRQTSLAEVCLQATRPVQTPANQTALECIRAQTALLISSLCAAASAAELLLPAAAAAARMLLWVSSEVGRFMQSGARMGITFHSIAARRVAPTGVHVWDGFCDACGLWLFVMTPRALQVLPRR